MTRVIEVIVSPQGETTVQTHGYAGADCLQASKFLEQSLGVIADDQMTAAFYETAPAEQPPGLVGGAAARRNPASGVAGDEQDGGLGRRRVSIAGRQGIHAQ